MSKTPARTADHPATTPTAATARGRKSVGASAKANATVDADDADEGTDTGSALDERRAYGVRVGFSSPPGAVKQTDVLSGAHYHIVPRPGSRKLAIFFSGSGAPDGVFHYWKIGQTTDAHVIYLNNGPNEWYQYGVEGVGDTLEDTIETLKSWARALGAESLYTVGGSMGAHGAVLYGLLLGAKSMGLGFESRLMLDGSRSRNLTSEDFVPAVPDLLPLMMKAKQPINAYLGEDDAADLASSLHIGAAPMVNLTVMRRTKHGVPSHLRARERLEPLIRAFIADEPLPDMVEAAVPPPTAEFADAFLEAENSLQTKDWPRMEAAARRAVAVRPVNTETQLLLGRSLQMQKRWEESLPPLRAALRLRKNHLEARYRLGLGLRVTGRHDLAVKTQAELLDIKPDHVPALREKGRAHVALGQADEALAAFEKAAELAATDAGTQAELKLARIWIERGAPAGSLKVASAEEQEAHARLAAGDHVAARAAFLKAAEIEEDPVDLRRQAAGCLGAGGDVAGQLAELARLAAEFPKSVSIRRDAAEAALRLGQAATAVEHLEAAAKVSPKDAETRNRLRFAQSLVTKGLNVEQVARVVNARSGKKGELEQSPARAADHLFVAGRYAEAREIYMSAYAADRTDVRLWRRAANCLGKMGDSKAEVIELRRLLAQHPDDPGALYDAGQAMMALGLAKQSLPYYRKLAALRPDDRVAAARLKQAFAKAKADMEPSGA